MANTVRLKRSAVQGKAPVVGDLSLGELAVNTYDGKLYMKKNDGSDAIVEIGAGAGASVTTSDTAPSSPADGDLWYRSSDGRMYVYYDDGSTAQWVDANPNLPVGSDTFERSGTTVSLANSGDTVNLDGDFTVDTNTLHVDSTNNLVGIGTTSPAVEFEVVGTARATALSVDASGYYTLSSGNPLFNFDSNDYLLYDRTSNYLQFVSGGTERVRVDSDGNVGIGTASPNNKLEIDDTSAQNTVISARNRSGVANSASIFQLLTTDSDGSSNTRFVNHTASHTGQFYQIAGSNLPTFFSDFDTQIFRSSNGTEAMRLDSNGQLLVGTDTAPGFGLIQAASAAGAEISLARDDASVVAGNQLGRISWFGNDGGTYQECGRITCAADGDHAANDKPSRLVLSTTADGASSPTERMRIDGKGFTKFKSGASSYFGGSGEYHEFITDVDNWTLICENEGSSVPYGILVRYSSITPNNTSSQFFTGSDSTGDKIQLRSNGGIANYQANNANLSDEREKKNIETLGSTWGCLKNWDLKKFHYNEDADTDDKRYGVIAQQIEQHCPEVISDWTKQRAEEAVLDEDGNVVTPAKEEILRKGVKEQQMMWMAIKALQEAQDRIEALETQNADLVARIEALEQA